MNFRSKNFDADQFEEMIETPRIRNLQTKKKAGKRKADPVLGIAAKKAQENAAVAQVAGEREEEFVYTYKAGMLEGEWLYSSLADFRDKKWIDDILRVVKGGKEASVYLCQAHSSTGTDFIAAKVYRPRKYRNLKNDWLYREGRTNLDESGRTVIKQGELNAIRHRTEFGRSLLHTSWLQHEFKTLQLLKAAGADVPEPYAAGENAILMEYFGDESMGAPTLNEVDIDRSEAKALFQRMLHNIEVMLAKDRVHGDLSAFNILYWDGDIVMIDFPQVIIPEANRSAYMIFQRDVVRVCEYFARKGVPSNPYRLAQQMWEKFNHRINPEVDPKILNEDRDDERSLWESLKNG